MKKKLFLAILVFIKSIATAQQLSITNCNAPNRVGERVLTFQCPMEGIPQKDIEVWVYYSDDKEQLSKSDCPRGRVSCKKNNSESGKLDCKFYFPHRDHITPNYILPYEKSTGEAVSESDLLDYLLSKPGTTQNGILMASITDKNPKSFNNPKKIYYKIVRERKATKSTSDVHDFTMPRVFVIGYMGDSFTSGEGAPYSGDDKWDDNLCHRSNKSGGMRGINKLIEIRRDLVVRVINTTCSGAKIGNLINQPQHSAAAIYYPNKKNSTKFSQLELIADWLKTNNRQNVDILLMGIGGNNIGFAEMATAASNPVRDLTTWERDALAAIEEAKDLLKDLPEKYDILDSVINNQDFEVGKILIMNYPNMLYGKNGKICDGTNTSPSACLDPTNFLFTHREAFKDIHNGLNDEVSKAAERNNWGIIRVSAINNHGMCNCDEPYFNTWFESISNQHDEKGSVHPNADGYQELYRDNVYAALNKAVPDVQKEEYKARMKEAIKDAKAAAKEKMDKQVAKNIARKKLQEKYKAELATKAESQLDSIKIEIPKTTKPVTVKLKNNDDPRPKNNNDDKN